MDKDKLLEQSALGWLILLAVVIVLDVITNLVLRTCSHDGSF